VQHLQHRGRELQETQGVGDGRAVAPNRVRDVLLREAELGDQAIIAAGLIDG